MAFKRAQRRRKPNCLRRKYNRLACAAGSGERRANADPLEMWGEALMLENRSDLALAKFEAANKEAPEWGRLHLKWGEALLFVGRRGEAKKQFAIAAHLSLFPDERAQLARDMATVARQ
jgi:tetratricopeptide (TPR) repeat protein